MIVFLYKNDNDNDIVLAVRDYSNDFIYNYHINDLTFIKGIVNNSKDIEDFHEIYNYDINDITKLIFKEIEETHRIFLKNSLPHNFSNYAYYISDSYREKKSYYFNGKKYEYDDWLKLPERMRELREEKLSLL